MKRNLNIAFLMDPLESLDLDGDTTFALALEAQRRKHKINFFKPEDLMFKFNDVFAKFELNLTKSEIDNFLHFEIGAVQRNANLVYLEES